MEKRATPILDPAEDAIVDSLASYIEQLQARIAELQRELEQIRSGEPA